MAVAVVRAQRRADGTLMSSLSLTSFPPVPEQLHAVLDGAGEEHARVDGVLYLPTLGLSLIAWHLG